MALGKIAQCHLLFPRMRIRQKLGQPIVAAAGFKPNAARIFRRLTESGVDVTPIAMEVGRGWLLGPQSETQEFAEGLREGLDLSSLSILLVLNVPSFAGLRWADLVVGKTIANVEMEIGTFGFGQQ